MKPVMRAGSSPVWFGPTVRPRFGWLGVPPEGRAGLGVVLCSPVGEEGRSAHRTFRRLGETLTDRGFVTLRFDYDGTGDSAGGQHDPDRVDAWSASIDDAVALVRSTGVASVALVGMRLGATLAAAWAARQFPDPGVLRGDPPGDAQSDPQGDQHPQGALAGLVLWDPAASGRTFLREGEALHSFSEDFEASDDGLRHTPGFQYDAATAKALRSLDLVRLPVAPLADRILLLERDDRPGHPGILARLQQEGDRLDLAPAFDQHSLLELPPSDCLVPERTLAQVVDWLTDVGSTTGAAVPVRVPATPDTVEVPSGAAPPRAARVREACREIGSEHDLGLVGVVTQPLGPVAPRTPWVVLVNVATEHHIGPGRRWVDGSRLWAAEGYRVLRMDQSGVGDSATRPGQVEDLAFAPEWLADLPAVVAELGREGAPVVLMGLCSGSYSALEAAARGGVAGIFAVNPRLTLWPATPGTPAFTRDRLTAVVPSAPIARLARRHRLLAGGLWRIYRQVAVWHAPYRSLAKVLRTGTVTEILACPDDSQHLTEVAFWRPALWLRERRRGTVLVTDPHLDHSLLTLGSQKTAWRSATAFLRRRFPVAAGAASGVPGAATADGVTTTTAPPAGTTASRSTRAVAR